MSRSDLNRANPNTLADQARALRLGDLLLGQMVQVKRKLNPSTLGVGSYTLGTLHALQLGERSRAITVSRAVVRAGGVTGELTPAAFGATPTTGQIAVAPNGDIVVLASDAITDMDVWYLPNRGDVVGTDDKPSYFPVVSNVLTLPTTGYWTRGVDTLLEVEAITGTSTGKKIVLVPGAGAPSAGQARLNLAKTTITFASADAVTRARVKVLIGTEFDLQSVLDETDDYV